MPVSGQLACITFLVEFLVVCGFELLSVVPPVLFYGQGVGSNVFIVHDVSYTTRSPEARTPSCFLKVTTIETASGSNDISKLGVIEFIFPRDIYAPLTDGRATAPGTFATTLFLPPHIGTHGR